LFQHTSSFGAQTEIHGYIDGGPWCSLQANPTEYGPRQNGTDGFLNAVDTQTISTDLAGGHEHSTSLADASLGDLEGEVGTVSGSCLQEGDLAAYGTANESLYDVITVTSSTLPVGTPVPSFGDDPMDTGLILSWSLAGEFATLTQGVNLGSLQFATTFIQPGFAPLSDPVSVASGTTRVVDLGGTPDREAISLVVFPWSPGWRQVYA
jgi:hypothetical protein